MKTLAVALFLYVCSVPLNAAPERTKHDARAESEQTKLKYGWFVSLLKHGWFEDNVKQPKLQESTVHSVPDTGSSVALLGLSLAGLVALRRKWRA